jgi:hypothetical protein
MRGAWLLSGCLLLGCPWLGFAQEMHRNGFAGPRPAWHAGAANARFQQHAHEITDEFAHGGTTSECIRLRQVELGDFIQYVYATPNAVVNDVFSASLFVRSNRSGLRLLARIVLPNETDPQKPGQKLTVLLPGDVYSLIGQWQRLSLARPAKLWREEQQKLRAQLGREISVTGAYVDQLVLNVYPGPGNVDVWIDDLEIGPVQPIDEPRDPTPVPGATAGTPTAQRHSRRPSVEMTRDHLLVEGQKFLLLGIRHSDTPLKTLRDAGFNTVFFEPDATPQQLHEAVAQGFWVVPTLPLTPGGAASLGGEGVNGGRATIGALLTGRTKPGTSDVDAIAAGLSRFMWNDAVLMWHLGGGRTAEQTEAVSRTASALRTADPNRPITADVWDGFRGYSRQLDLVGAHRWPLYTSLSLEQYRDWLMGCRRLARPGSYQWTWVQTHLPEWYTQLVYHKPSTASFAEPIGPQPEQLRLLTYIALGSGCRGLGFWSDRFLADSHRGADRLTALALLNQELIMLQPILTTLLEPPEWIDTSNDQVKAAILRSERGVAVLPIWIGGAGQCVPGQSAVTQLGMIVKQIPNGTQCWEVSPGSVRTLPTTRELGGVKVNLPIFDLTAAVVFTSDARLVEDWQRQERNTGQKVAHWANEIAVEELRKVKEVQAQLVGIAPDVPDAQGHLNKCEQYLAQARQHYQNKLYPAAYQSALAAARPLRQLMRLHWETAQRSLTTVTATPYSASFFTLPQHWQLLHQLRTQHLGPDLLGDGHFEPAGYDPVRNKQLQAAGQVPPKLVHEAGYERPARWIPQQIALDPVDTNIGTDVPGADGSVYALKLSVATKLDAERKPTPAPAALERTFVALTSPAVRATPGSWVRISGSVYVSSKTIGASVDGALVYDSVGGEPLAVRLTTTNGVWKKFFLYRPVPESGLVSVTCALTGIGTAHFDEIKIEPYLPGAAPAVGQRPEGARR